MTDWPSTVVAILALAVSGASYLVGLASKRAAQGEVFGRLMGDYASPEMGAALRCIRRHEAALAEAASGETSMDHMFGPLAREMDELRDAGRRLHLFVRQAAVLLSNSIISAELFKAAVVDTEGYRLWARSWVPYVRSPVNEADIEGELAWVDELLRKHPGI